MRKIRPLLALAPLLLVSCSCSPTGKPAGQEQSDGGATATASRTAGAVGDATVNPADGSVTAVHAVAAPGQILRLTLLDEKSHTAIYHAGLNLADSQNLAWTDRNGQSTWTGSIATSGAIEIRCPALRAETGRKIRSVPYAMAGKLTDVSATINSAECTEPPEKSTAGAYVGMFYKYYDHGGFVPCAGLPADAAFYGNSKNAWVDFTETSTAELQGMLPSDPQLAENGVYVEWSGVLTGPGAYGKQGSSAYKFDVTHVVKVSKEPPGNCPAGNAG